MLFDVLNNRDRDQVADAHFTAQEQSDFGAADVVLDELLDDMDVVFPWLQGCEGFVDIGPTAFNYKGLVQLAWNVVSTILSKMYPVFAQNVIQVLLTPHTRSRHGMNQIRASQQRHTHWLTSAIGGLDPLAHGINLVIEMVQHDGSWLVLLLERFPGVRHQPVRGLIDGQLAHGNTMTSISEKNTRHKKKKA